MGHQGIPADNFCSETDQAYVLGPFTDAFLPNRPDIVDIVHHVWAKTDQDLKDEQEAKNRDEAYLKYCKKQGHKPYQEPVSINGVPLIKHRPNFDVYIGKVRSTFKDRIECALGYRPNTRYKYTPEVLERMLEYAKSQRLRKVRIINGTILSELFNGPQDIQHCLDKKQFDATTQRIEKKLDFRPEIVALEDLPEHQDLFVQLEKVKEEFVDLHKAYHHENPALSEIPTSLEIARLLYKAIYVDKVKGDNFLMQRLIEAVPEGVLAKCQNDEEKILRSGYGLTEVAIRLSEILRGNNCHGGVERQHKYDKFIHLFFPYNNKPALKQYPALQPLVELCRGKRFEAIHFHTDKNPVVIRRIVNGTLLRLGLMALAGATAFGCVWTGGRMYEGSKQQKNQAAADEYINSILESVTFYNDFEGRTDADSFAIESKREKFDALIEKICTQIVVRYQIPPNLVRHLKPDIQGELLEDPTILDEIYLSVERQEAFADFIAQKKKLFFRVNGYVISHPYQHLDEISEDLFKAATKDKTQDFEAVYHHGNDAAVALYENQADGKKPFMHFKGEMRPYDAEDKFEIASHLGPTHELFSFFSASYNSTVMTDDQNFTKLIFINDYADKFRTILSLHPLEIEKLSQYGLPRGAMFYSTVPVKAVAEHYVDSMRRYDALQISDRIGATMWEMCRHPDRFQADFEVNSDVNLEFCISKYACQQTKHHFKDRFGQFDFQLRVVNTYVDQTKEISFHVVAKQPDEKSYSVATAMDASSHYCDLVNNVRRTVDESDWIPFLH